MNIYADLQSRVAAILLRLTEQGVLRAGIDVAASSARPAPAGSRFDAVVDAALVHARASVVEGGDPRALARLLAAEIALDPRVAEVEATERGFVAVGLRPAYLAAALSALLDRGRRVPAVPRAWPEGGSLAAARAAVVDEALNALGAAAGLPPSRIAREDPRDPATPSLQTEQGFVGRPPEPCSAGPRTVGPVSVTRCSGAAVPDGVAVGLCAAAEVCGPEALRFAFAAAEPATPLTLDLDALADRWRGNPAFWVPYAHARCRAALRRAASRRPGDDLSPSALADDAVRHLHRPADLRALRAVLRMPWVMAGCAASRSARGLALHLAEVADAVSVPSSASTYQPQSRFVNEERRDCVGVRLGLVSASALVLETGLGVLGLTAPDEVL